MQVPSQAPLEAGHGANELLQMVAHYLKNDIAKICIIHFHTTPGNSG
jgi:hypothetical protein